MVPRTVPAVGVAPWVKVTVPRESTAPVLVVVVVVTVPDRKSVVEGKILDLGGGRMI